MDRNQFCPCGCGAPAFDTSHAKLQKLSEAGNPSGNADKAGSQKAICLPDPGPCWSARDVVVDGEVIVQPIIGC